MPFAYDDQNIFAKILRGEIPELLRDAMRLVLTNLTYLKASYLV